MKNQTVLIVAIFSAMLMVMSFAEESSSRKFEDKAVRTPSVLINDYRACFSPDGDMTGLDSNTGVRAMRLSLMTNVVCSVVQSRLADEDVEAGVLMMKGLWKSQAVMEDKEAVVYMLNVIPALRPVSTNDYARELRDAGEADAEIQRERRRRPGSLSVVGPYRGPNTRKLDQKWTPVFDNNRNCAELRGRLVDAFASAFPDIIRALSPKDVEALVDAVRNNEGLAGGEKERILGFISPLGDE